MEEPLSGDVVVLPFPFSDLSDAKQRPALVLKTFPTGELILAQITSRFRYDVHELPLRMTDFLTGGLPLTSAIRLNKLFTSDKEIVLRKAGSVKGEKLELAREKVIAMLRS